MFAVTCPGLPADRGIKWVNPGSIHIPCAKEPDYAQDDIVLTGVGEGPIVAGLELDVAEVSGAFDGMHPGQAVVHGVAGFKHAGIASDGDQCAALALGMKGNPKVVAEVSGDIAAVRLRTHDADFGFEGAESKERAALRSGFGCGG